MAGVGGGGPSIYISSVPFQKRNGLTQDLTWFQLALNLDTRNY